MTPDLAQRASLKESRHESLSRLVVKEERRPFHNLRPRQTDLAVCDEKAIADVIHIPAEYRQESSVCCFASNTHNSAHVLPVTGGSIRGGENSY